MFISDYQHLTLHRNAERQLARDLEIGRLFTPARGPRLRERVAAWLLGTDVGTLVRQIRQPVRQASPGGVAR